MAVDLLRGLLGTFVSHHNQGDKGDVQLEALTAALRRADSETSGSVREQAQSSEAMATVLQSRGDWGGAAIYWRDAFRIVYQARFLDSIIKYCQRMCYSFQKAGEMNLALSYTKMLCGLSEKWGTLEDKGWAYNQLARCFYDLSSWFEMLDAATYALEHSALPFYHTLARLRVACALNRLARYEEAMCAASAAVMEFKAQQHTTGVVWAMNEAARALCGMTQYRKGILMARKALNLNSDPVIDETELGRTYAIIGLASVAQGQHRAAGHYLRSAKEIFHRSFAPADEMEVNRELAIVTQRRTTA